MPTPLNAGLGLFDPAAASDVLPGGRPARRPATPHLTHGLAIDWALQCRYRDGRCALFQAGDTPAAAIDQDDVGPVVVPAVAFFADGGLQTGRDQGQVLVSLSNAQAAQLWPTGGALRYTLVVTLAPVASPSRTIEIVRLPLVVTSNY